MTRRAQEKALKVVSAASRKRGFRYHVRVRSYNGAIDSYIRVRALSVIHADARACELAAIRHEKKGYGEPGDWYMVYVSLDPGDTGKFEAYLRARREEEA